MKYVWSSMKLWNGDVWKTEQGNCRRCYFRSQLHCVQLQSFFWVAGNVKPMACNYRSSMAFKGKQITAACEGGSLISAIYLCSELPIVWSIPEFPRWPAPGSLGLFGCISDYRLGKLKDFMLYLIFLQVFQVQGFADLVNRLCHQN